VVEGFPSTPKLSLNLDHDLEILTLSQQLQRDLAFWIQSYYYHDPRYPTVGYTNPIDYEQGPIASRKLTPVNP